MKAKMTRKLAAKASLTFVCILATFAPMPAGSQNPQRAAVSFEAASIKPSGTANAAAGGDCRGTDSHPGNGTIGLGRCVFQRMTLKELVSAAFSPVYFGGRLGLPMNRIELSGDFGWVNSERFDINAKAEATSMTTEEELYEMLRQLLADRFRLKFRRVTREVPGYVLQVAKGGLKMQRATGKEPRAGTILPGAPPSGGFIGGQAHPVESIATFLQARLGRPVRDDTGLTGLFNWQLRWAPDDNELRPDGLPVPPRAADDFRPSFMTALQEQLGLRLESGQVTIEILVIEQAEKPIPN